MKEITLICKKCKNEITIKAREEKIKELTVRGCIVLHCIECNYYNVVEVKESE
jgi:hypothetical protein